jgi:hypothetical protein
MASAMRYEEDVSDSGSSDSDEIAQLQKKRGKGKIYELPSVSFANVESAETHLLKKKLFGASWKRLNARVNTVWYKCKGCDKHLKLSLIDDSLRCTISIEQEFHEIDHEHINDAQQKENGLTQEVKDKVLTYSGLGAKPVAKVEQLRTEG